jgi:hypothetical protein
MSFNRTNYDENAYELKMKRSTNPGLYRLYKGYGESCSNCYSNYGPVNSNGDVSISKQISDTNFENMVDVESKLSWRRKKLSKNNEDETINFTPNVINRNNCSNFLVSQDTRFSNPIDNYREMDTTSYKFNPYLSVNPQDYIQPINDKLGLDSRNFMKDNLCKVKYQHNYLDDGKSLPVQQNIKCSLPNNNNQKLLLETQRLSNVL